MDEQEKKDPSHIRQTIKGKPLSFKSFLIRLLIVCVFAAAAALVAAFVFVNALPVARQMSGQVTPTPRVTIPVTEEPSVSISPTPSSAPSETVVPSKTTTPVPTKTAEPKVTQSAAPTPTATEEPKETKEPSKQDSEKDKDKSKEEGSEKTSTPVPEELTVDQYIKLQNKMLEIAKEAEKSVVIVTAISSQMDYFNQSVENRQQISGVIIAGTQDAFYVLTESRILKNIERIQVTFSDGTIADAIYMKDDPDTGLAVVKVNTDGIGKESLENISVASLGNSYSVTTGDVVIAIGAPNGYSNSISFGKITSTNSVISAFDCEYNLLATDISGTKDGSGILVDLKGCVVGIIDQSFSNQDSQIVTGLPVSQLKALIEQLSNGESRAFIGIKGSEVNNSVSDKTGIPKGVIVTEVADESPAFFAGLSEYDVIIQMGEDKVSNMSQYKNALAKLVPGDETVLLVLRKGAEGYTEIKFEITIGER